MLYGRLARFVETIKENAMPTISYASSDELADLTRRVEDLEVVSDAHETRILALESADPIDPIDPVDPPPTVDPAEPLVLELSMPGTRSGRHGRTAPVSATFKQKDATTSVITSGHL